MKLDELRRRHRRPRTSPATGTPTSDPEEPITLGWHRNNGTEWQSFDVLEVAEKEMAVHPRPVQALVCRVAVKHGALLPNPGDIGELSGRGLGPKRACAFMKVEQVGVGSEQNYYEITVKPEDQPSLSRRVSEVKTVALNEAAEKAMRKGGMTGTIPSWVKKVMKEAEASSTPGTKMSWQRDGIPYITGGVIDRADGNSLDFTNKCSHDRHDPKRGDIVILEVNGKKFVNAVERVTLKGHTTTYRLKGKGPVENASNTGKLKCGTCDHYQPGIKTCDLHDEPHLHYDIACPDYAAMVDAFIWIEKPPLDNDRVQSCRFSSCSTNGRNVHVRTKAGLIPAPGQDGVLHYGGKPWTTTVVKTTELVPEGCEIRLRLDGPMRTPGR